MPILSNNTLFALEYLNTFPEEFLRKVSLILSLQVPFVHGCLEDSQAKLLEASVDFMYAQDKVERWSKLVDNKKHLVPQERDDKQLIETDLDHVISMLYLAKKIFVDSQYAALAKVIDRESVLNGIFVHDGGEIGDVGDVTHADEEKWITTHDEQKTSEHENLITFWSTKVSVRELRGRIRKELLKPYFDEEFRSSIEGNFIKFLDRFQAALFGIQHIYPYEEQYKEKKVLEEYIAKYLLEQCYQIIRLLPEKAQESLREFIMDQLPEEFVKEAYEKALMLGSINEKEKVALVQAILSILAILYRSSDASAFVRDWHMLRETDDFSAVKAIEGF